VDFIDITNIFVYLFFCRAVVKGRWGVRGRGLRQSAGIDVPWRCFVKEKLALFREGLSPLPLSSLF
jgi:hypothetical protein